MSFIWEFVRGVFNFFKESPAKEGFKPFLYWIFRGSPLTLRLLTGLFLIPTIVLGIAVTLNLSDSSAVLVSALASRWERSEMTHMAMESFLVSTILSDISKQDLEKIQSAEINQSATAALGVIQKKLIGQDRQLNDAIAKFNQGLSVKSVAKPSKKASNEQEKATGVHAAAAQTPSIPITVLSGRENARNTDPGANFSLTDDMPGYLFVPGIMLSTPTEFIGATGAQDAQQSMQLTLNKEPWLFEDVFLSRQIASDLCGNLSSLNNQYDNKSIFVNKDDLPILSPYYSQSYVIFQSGVVRLCESGVSADHGAQVGYYHHKFSPVTLLQSRRYFQSTIDDTQIGTGVETSKASIRTYFHSTEPYIDLGGNGVVETFCKHIPVQVPLINRPEVNNDKAGVYATDAILCLDFRLQRSLDVALAPRISRFGGSTAVFQCTDQSGCNLVPRSETNNQDLKDGFLGIFFSPDKVTDDDRSTLNGRYKSLAEKNRQSEITGQILATYPPGTNKISFTVPLGESKLLAGKLDLAAYERQSSLLLFAFAACFASVIFFGGLILVDYIVKIKEQEKAFEAVDTVMSDVPAAYLRVDENGKIYKFNEAFATALGYDTLTNAEAALKGKEFTTTLLDDKYRAKYLRIREARNRGEQYKSYRLKVKTKSGLKIFEIHGWNVPSPRTSHNKLGQSFGILIPRDSLVQKSNPVQSHADSLTVN